MLIETAAKYIGLAYLWTWYVWPFVFVYSFANGIVRKMKDDAEAWKSLMWAGIAMTMIVCGFLNIGMFW